MYAINASDNNVESIDHPAGNFKASFDQSRTFGRDALREIIDRLGLKESETLINGHRHKVFHNDQVAITMTKDPWVDYPRDADGNKVKRPVYRDEWGGRHNPLKPARTGYIRIIGTRSEVMSAYNLIAWRSLNKAKFLGKWGV